MWDLAFNSDMQVLEHFIEVLVLFILHDLYAAYVAHLVVIL